MPFDLLEQDGGLLYVLPMRTMRILGLLEDGSTRAAKMQASAKRRLQLYRGESLVLYVECRTPSGAPVDISGATITMAVSMVFENPLMVKTATVDQTQGPSVVKFVLTTADYASLPQGRVHFVFDIWMSANGDRSLLVPTSPLDALDTAAALP